MFNIQDDGPLVCGHRGAAACAPENTMASLQIAADAGAAMAEVDVRLTADGEPVLFHDAALGRTAPGRGSVSRQSLAELRRLDAGSWFAAGFAGEKIPTLAEALAWAAGIFDLNIELKTDGESPARSRALATAVLAEIERQRAGDRCLLTSFDHRLIDAVAESRPELRCGRIFGAAVAGGSVTGGPGALVSVRHGLITAETIAAARTAEKTLMAWTVNEPSDLRRLAGLGVAAVITDDPGLARAVLRR